MKFEQDYKKLVELILSTGEHRETRNHATLSIFGTTLEFDVNASAAPIIMGRQMYHRGVLGELAAMLRGPKHLDDFEKWGCNYWKKWAKPDGSIEVDYGNAWLDNGQMDHVRNCLLHNRSDRRMLINGWRPERLSVLDLPCCHFSYQFYVRSDLYLDMVWTQRSVDVMVGLPSDIIFAWAWLVSMASWAGLLPGKIKMDFGDTHIYTNHVPQAFEYCLTYDKMSHTFKYPNYGLANPGKDFLEFEPGDIVIDKYTSPLRLELELNA